MYICVSLKSVTSCELFWDLYIEFNEGKGNELSARIIDRMEKAASVLLKQYIINIERYHTMYAP